MCRDWGCDYATAAAARAGSHAALNLRYLSSFCLVSTVNATALPDPLARSERLPLLALPISAARMLSPGIVCAVVRLPIVRMNHNVGAGRIVISVHRMPAGGAGLIADDGRRRAVALNRYRRCASRRARRRSLSGGWRRSCECRKSRGGGQCGNQETFHRKLLWLDPPDPLGIMPRKRYVSGLCSELLRRLFAGDDGWNHRCLLRSEVVVVNRHRASPRA